MLEYRTFMTIAVTEKTTIDELKRRLIDAIRQWWDNEQADWDALVNNSCGVAAQGSEDLWDCMPVVDSKAVARTSPIFQEILGLPLDINLIRRGGYKTLDDMLSDLVPKMIRFCRKELKEKLQ